MNSPFSIMGGNSTKEKIIELLTEEWPLSAKKIYRRLTKNFHLGITYQATHKALKELTENKILEKRKEGYLLNKEWIEKLDDFSKKIKDELGQADKNREIKTIHKLIFKTHRDFIKFHVDFIEKIMKTEGKAEMVFHYRHVPYPHVLSNEEIKRIRQLMPKLKWKILAKKITPVGKWCAKQWKKLGVQVEMGADISGDRVIIINDYVLNIYMPREAIEKWDKGYSVKNIKDYDIELMSDAILNQKYKTIVTVMKDKEIASLLKK